MRQGWERAKRQGLSGWSGDRGRKSAKLYSWRGGRRAPNCASGGLRSGRVPSGAVPLAETQGRVWSSATTAYPAKSEECSPHRTCRQRSSGTVGTSMGRRCREPFLSCSSGPLDSKEPAPHPRRSADICLSSSHRAIHRDGLTCMEGELTRGKQIRLGNAWTPQKTCA